MKTETKVTHTPGESQPHARGGHSFNTARPCPDCPGRVFHYSCIDCGADCTAGTKHGPSHSDSRKQYRCHECHLEDAKRISALNAAAPDMLEALLHADEACANIVAPEEWPRKEIRAAIAKAKGGAE